jgi:hypothetical protein
VAKGFGCGLVRGTARSEIREELREVVAGDVGEEEIKKEMAREG